MAFSQSHLILNFLSIMVAYHNYLTMLIIALISFLIGSSIHRYSHSGGIFVFYRKFVIFAYEETFRTPEKREKYYFILKPLLDCTECFCGWISIIIYCNQYFFTTSSIYLFISNLIITAFLTMFITRKLD